MPRDASLSFSTAEVLTRMTERTGLNAKEANLAKHISFSRKSASLHARFRVWGSSALILVFGVSFQLF